MFSEFDEFTGKETNDPEIESLREEFRTLKERAEAKETPSAAVIITPSPIVLNLSENSNQGSEENSPKNEKDSMASYSSRKGNSSLKISKSRAVYRELFKRMNEECHLVLEETCFRVSPVIAAR